MAVITLSWQYGCLGDQIAEDAANQLGYRVIGKQEIHDMLVQATGQASKELDLDQSLKTAGEEIEPGFFHRLHHKHAAYTNLLMALIYQAASQDRVIIKGYGAQIVLTHQPHVFCVRLKGGFDVRVARVQQHHKLDQWAAKELVKKEDHERVEFIRYIFKREVANVEWYDMIFDIEKVTLETVTEVIVSIARAVEKSHPAPESEKTSLHALAFEHQIKAIVQRRVVDLRDFEVTMSPKGIVTVSGQGTSESDKTFIEQRIRSFPEVQNVVNKIKVVRLFREHVWM